MTRLIVACAILIGLNVCARADDTFLLCRPAGAYTRFALAVDLAKSALTEYDNFGRSAHFRATVTPDYIEYDHGMIRTRINRSSGDWVGWSYTGQMSGRGTCQITDDRRRLDEYLCCTMPKPAK